MNTSEDSGLYALSTVPGLSIQSDYNPIPPAVYAPNTWAWVSSADAFALGSQPWHGGGTPKYVRFVVIYDGTAVDGTEGKIQIAVNEGPDNEFHPRIIGNVDIHVRSSVQPTWFTTIATAGAISGNRLVLDHPYLNGNPGLFPFVTHVKNPPGATPMTWNHAVGVSYDSMSGRWGIYNVDGAAMPVGIGFNVRIETVASKVTASTIRVQTTLPIDDPSANGNPYATIIVCPAGGSNLHPIAVRYIAPSWYIVNSDGAVFGLGSSFHVKVFGFTSYWDSQTYPQSTGHIDSFYANSAGMSIETPAFEAASPARGLYPAWQLGNSSVPLIVSANLTPPISTNTQVADPKYVGVSFSGGATPRWQVYHEDSTNMPAATTYNFWGPPQLSAY